jgi:hypothetical protein
MSTHDEADAVVFADFVELGRAITSRLDRAWAYRASPVPVEVTFSRIFSVQGVVPIPSPDPGRYGGQ